MESVPKRRVAKAESAVGLEYGLRTNAHTGHWQAVDAWYAAMDKSLEAKNWPAKKAELTGQVLGMVVSECPLFSAFDNI